MVPGRPPRPPRGPQESPKRRPGGSKRRPRGLQEAPKRPPRGPNRMPGGFSSSLFLCMLCFPDQSNSSGHRLWIVGTLPSSGCFRMGWRGFARRAQFCSVEQQAARANAGGLPGSFLVSCPRAAGAIEGSCLQKSMRSEAVLVGAATPCSHARTGERGRRAALPRQVRRRPPRHRSPYRCPCRPRSP